MVKPTDIALVYRWMLRRSRHRRRRVKRLMMAREAHKKRMVIFAVAIKTLITSMLMTNSMMNQTRVHRVWCVPRSRDWWENIVLKTYIDQQWIANFRMVKDTFNWLCGRLNTLKKEDTRCRESIPVDLRVAITLYYLASGSSHRTIGNLFGVSRPSVTKIIPSVLLSIVTILLPEFICIPTGNRLDEVVEGFERRWGFPQCVGAIDGTHIPVTPPREDKIDYQNRKGWTSVIAQCVVDHQCLFMDVFTGWPGRSHDARVLR